jgi:hypothetical protein
MIPIYSAKVERPVNGVIICPALVGVELHYYDNRSRPCMKHVLPCEGCERHIDLRWKGYLGCWDRGKGRLFLAEVTREAYDRMPLFEQYKGRLRGMTIRLDRTGQSKNSRVSAKLAVWAGPAHELPPVFNMQEALERIWWTDAEGKFRQPVVDCLFAAADQVDEKEIEIAEEGGKDERQR